MQNKAGNIQKNRLLRRTRRPKIVDIEKKLSYYETPSVQECLYEV